MKKFQYDCSTVDAEYYELLDSLMVRWESEIVEFKEAKGQYSEEKVGQYFSAISNEANLKQQQYGWLVLGVSEQKVKFPVGTAFKKGAPSLLEKFKYDIARKVTDGLTFLDIIELYPVVEGVVRRVLMFKVPAAATGMHTAWNNRYYGRVRGKMILQPHGKEFFTSHGKHFFHFPVSTFLHHMVSTF